MGHHARSLPAYSELGETASVATSERGSASDWAGRIDLILNDAFANALDHSASLNASGIAFNLNINRYLPRTYHGKHHRMHTHGETLGALSNKSDETA